MLEEIGKSFLENIMPETASPPLPRLCGEINMVSLRTVRRLSVHENAIDLTHRKHLYTLIDEEFVEVSPRVRSDLAGKNIVQLKA